MKELHTAILILHIVVGACTLVLFWLPMLSKKGSAWHKKTGQWFRWGMYTVALAGVSLAGLVLMDPLSIRQPAMTEPAALQQFLLIQRLLATFLAMLSLLALLNIRHGSLVLEAGLGRAALRQFSHQLLLGTVLIMGVWVLFLGVRYQFLLLEIFGPIAILNASQALRFSWRAEVTKAMALREHISHFLACGIAVYTAFFAFGARRIMELPATGQLLSWTLPAVFGVAAMLYYQRRYAPLSKKPVRQRSTEALG